MLKRKDDIRRRLTIAQVPEPPVDLAQKIKREIPKHYVSKTAKQVAAQNDRKSVPGWNFWGFSWQLAAAILVLVGLTWSVFEAYKTELDEATAVAENEVTVEEFEDSITSPPVIRVDGTARQAAKDDDTEAKVKADEPAPVSTIAEASEFAPEAAPPPGAPPARKQARELSVAEAVTVTKPASVEQTDESTALYGRREDAEGEASGAVQKEAVGAVVAAQSTAAAGDEATWRDEQFAARAPAERDVVLAETERLEEARAGIREVAVVGLEAETTVTVRIRLNESGRVVETYVVDVDDPAIVSAVKEASKEWTFDVNESDDRRGTSSRTIEVRLKQAN